MGERDARSINFAVSERGLETFQQIGLGEAIKQAARILNGRVIHTAACADKFMYYYGTETYSLRRDKVLALMYENIIDDPNVDIIDSVDHIEIDRDNAKTTANKTNYDVGFIVGADGAFSQVRQPIIEKQPVSFTQEFFEWRYIEFILESDDAHQFVHDGNKINFWCAEGAMFAGMPNRDDTLSLMFVFHKHNEDRASRETLIRRLFTPAQADKLISLMTDKISWLTRVLIDKWHYKDKIVLLGDSAHALYPFYGQEMNLALEDALELYCAIKNTTTLKDAFERYEHKRRPETGLLSQISTDHFYELENKSRSYFSLHNCIVDKWLSKKYPTLWIYSYDAFTTKKMQSQNGRKHY